MDEHDIREQALKPKERHAVIDALRNGVTPVKGVDHVTVGRDKEIDSFKRNVAKIKEDGAAFRFIIGEYGAGKSHFLHLVRNHAISQGLVTLHADLTPERRLHHSGGFARNLYAELMKNMSNRSNRDGDALKSVVERFITKSQEQAKKKGLNERKFIEDRLSRLTDDVSGYDFAKVISVYWKAYEQDNKADMETALRWLRGEFANKTEMRKAFGNATELRTIIDDTSLYRMFKLLARFVCLTGYGGLIILIDEMALLYKISHKNSRESNYEQILAYYNDINSGSAEHLGFVMAGTTDFLECEKRGLYSYGALKSRLEDNKFARKQNLIDYDAPMLRLDNLSQNTLLELLRKIRHVYAYGIEKDYLVPDECLDAFYAHCYRGIGADCYRTPRNTVREFVSLLSIIEQNPDRSWHDFIDKVEIRKEIVPDIPDFDDNLIPFKL
ncbi:MAG: ATP-binding protein [Proteobacteria bacterium]|nr:ATP-binding protein [Pseudomonadota bacterium]